MSEFKEIDLTQLQKVEVRDSDNAKWQKAYLIKKLDNHFRVMFKNTSVDYFEYCRPYKEPTKRPMTDREIFNALKKEDCWLRLPENTANQFCTWNKTWIAEEYEITYDGGETWNKLEVEE